MPPEILALLASAGLSPQQVPPQQLQAMLQYIMQPGAPVDPFQGGNGFDIGDANKQVDYGRDMNTLLADNMTGAMAGLGGYSGVDAFMPTREYVEGPQNQRLQEYLNKPTDTLEGWLAQKIVGEGASPLTITAEARAFLEAQDEDLTDPAQAKIRDQLMQFARTDDYSGETYYDFGSLEKLASDLEAESFLQQDPNIQQEPETGKWYREVPSEQEQWYKERGLPLPTMQYELSDFSPAAAQADQRAQQAQLRSDISKESGLYDQANAMRDVAYDRYLQAMQNGRPQAGGVAPQPQSAPAAGSGGSGPSVYDQVGQALDQLPGVRDDSLDRYLGGIAWQLGDPSAIARGAESVVGDQIDKMAAAKAIVSRLLGAATEGPGSGVTADSARPISEEMMQKVIGSGAMAGGPNATDRHRGRVDANSGRRDQEFVNRARNDFLRSTRNSGTMRQARDNNELYRAQQEAAGRRFYGKQADGSWGFGPDTGVVQGKVDYAQAMAQGRTPLSDTLRQRALAAYLMGR